MIRYADILPETVTDGAGIRVIAFLQGCPRHCKSCHNEDLIPIEGGKTVSERKFANEILHALSPLHSGVTFSGGEPLLQADALFEVISMIKENKPATNIWVYTGYVYEEIAHLSVMRLIDVVVDGPFILAQRSPSLTFRGSSNQRIIDVKQSRQLGKILELYLDREVKAM
jgi:anaerobic ribonucleoside-triphosphate reductase activating protein